MTPVFSLPFVQREKTKRERGREKKRGRKGRKKREKKKKGGVGGVASSMSGFVTTLYSCSPLRGDKKKEGEGKKGERKKEGCRLSRAPSRSL